MFFIVNAFNGFGMFCFLKFLAKILIVPTHIFVLTTIAIELYTTVRNI